MTINKRLLLTTTYALDGIKPQPDFDHTDPAWTALVDEAVARGLLELVGVDADGKPIYSRRK
jgi:hypothetical protein